MDYQDNLGVFLKENKDILKEYLETRYEIIRLKSIRSTSRVLGLVGWVLIAALLFLLILVFGGMALGFWFSAMMKSNVLGFGTTALLVILIFILCGIFRKQLFINPIIRAIIRHSHEDGTDEGK
jgi:hypothetical protein